MIWFRKIRRSDLGTLLKWKNDPLKMYNSGRHVELTQEENEREFEIDRDYLYIAYLKLGDNIIDIGTVLIVDRGDGYVGIPFSIAPEYRGCGIGKEMVKAAAQYFPMKKKAKVKVWNIASIKCLEYAGFKFRGVENDMFIYTIE